jgi:hypothetical protein
MEKAGHKVPLMLSEEDIDLLHQALNLFHDHLREIGMVSIEVEQLQERLGQAEDKLVELQTIQSIHEEMLKELKEPMEMD